MSQGTVPTCWLFAATQAMSIMYNQQSSQSSVPLNFSPQQSVSCLKDFGGVKEKFSYEGSRVLWLNSKFTGATETGYPIEAMEWLSKQMSGGLAQCHPSSCSGKNLGVKGGVIYACNGCDAGCAPYVHSFRTGSSDKYTCKYGSGTTAGSGSGVCETPKCSTYGGCLTEGLKPLVEQPACVTFNAADGYKNEFSATTVANIKAALDRYGVLTVSITTTDPGWYWGRKYP